MIRIENVKIIEVYIPTGTINTVHLELLGDGWKKVEQIPYSMARRILTAYKVRDVFALRDKFCVVRYYPARNVVDYLGPITPEPNDRSIEQK